MRAPDSWPTPKTAFPAATRPLRIGIVTEYYYPHLGGICEHVHFFAEEARRRGHEVDIITSQIGDTPAPPGVIYVGRSQPWYGNQSLARISIGVGLRRKLRRVFRERQYDIVHAHSPLTPILPTLAVDEAECPVIGTFHTYFDKSLGYQLGRRYFQKRLEKLSAAIAVSNSCVTALERYFSAEWKIIPNGIDTTLFEPDAPRPLDIRPDVPSILFLGRFDPRNGLSTLIDAFRQVRGKNRPAQLVVVGDGPLRNHYRGVAGNDPDITFVGSVLEGRPGYYAHSSMYACPTTRASFGITLLESMACATPVVCSDILGFRDVVQHEREALMFPCGDQNALADDLVRLLDDDTLRARLGETGRERAQLYSWPRVTDQVLALYHRLLGTRSIAA